VCRIGCGEQGAGPSPDRDAGREGGGGDPEGTASSRRALTSDSTCLSRMLQAANRAERMRVLRMWLASVQREVCARTAASRRM
jgi:hypothetical protein